MKRTLLLMVISLLVFSGCNLRQRETEVRNKMRELNEKERELSIEEQDLQRREDLLNKKEKISDSIINRPAIDSLNELHPKIPGTWNVKMVCSGTTCAGSAIGDTKTEKWNITFEQNVVIANAINNGKITRVYVGGYQENTLKLTSQPIDSTDSNEAQIVIHLEQKDEGKMDGEREIIRPDCHIVYDLRLNKK